MTLASHSPTENLPFALAAERRQSIDVVHGAERELDRERHATQGHGHVEPLHLLRKTDEMLAAAEARRRDLELKRVIKTCVFVPLLVSPCCWTDH